MTVVLGRVAEVNPPVPEFSNEADSPVTFVPLECVWPDGRADFTRTRPANEVSTGYTLFRRGDVLVPKITPTFESGRVAVANIPTKVGAGTTELHIVRPRSGVDARFLAYVLRSQPFLQDGATRLQGVGNLRRVPADFLAKFPVAISDPQQQRAIADYLDRETAQIDTLIEEQQRLTTLLRERRRAEFDRVLTSDAAGQPVRLKHIVSAITQGWSPQAYPWPADGIEEWGVLKAGAVNNGVFRPAENKQLPDEVAPRPDLAVRRGQIVVSRANTRDLVGSAALIEEDFPRLMLCDKLFAFDLDETLVDPSFVAMTLNTSLYRRLLEAEATGSSHSMQNISLSDIMNLPLNLPSVTRQREIVQSVRERLERIDRSIAETERFVELSAERRAALITAAVTGQIDLEGAA